MYHVPSALSNRSYWHRSRPSYDGFVPFCLGGFCSGLYSGLYSRASFADLDSYCKEVLKLDGRSSAHHLYLFSFVPPASAAYNEFASLASFGSTELVDYLRILGFSEYLSTFSPGLYYRSALDSTLYPYDFVLGAARCKGSVKKMLTAVSDCYEMPLVALCIKLY